MIMWIGDPWFPDASQHSCNGQGMERDRHQEDVLHTYA